MAEYHRVKNENDRIRQGLHVLATERAILVMEPESEEAEAIREHVRKSMNKDADRPTEQLQPDQSGAVA